MASAAPRAKARTAVEAKDLLVAVMRISSRKIYKGLKFGKVFLPCCEVVGGDQAFLHWPRFFYIYGKFVCALQNFWAPSYPSSKPPWPGCYVAEEIHVVGLRGLRLDAGQLGLQRLQPQHGGG